MQIIVAILLLIIITALCWSLVSLLRVLLSSKSPECWHFEWHLRSYTIDMIILLPWTLFHACQLCLVSDCNRGQALTVQQHWLVIESHIFCHICCMELNSVSNAFSLPYYVSVYMYHNLQTSPPTQVLEATQVEQLLLPCRCCSCAKLACSCILVRRYALFHSRQIYAHKRTMKPPKPVKKYFSTKRMNMKPRWVYPRRGETVALPYQRICFCVERRSKEVSPCVKCYCDIRGAKM